MHLFKIIGWIGAIAYILAYLLLSLKKISSEQVFYHTLNALGGICLVINSFFFEDSPNFVVNIIWMLIALYSITRISRPLILKYKIAKRWSHNLNKSKT